MIECHSSASKSHELKMDKGGNLYHSVRVMCETGNAKQQIVTNSRIKTSAVEGVLKILEIHAKATEF